MLLASEVWKRCREALGNHVAVLDLASFPKQQNSLAGVFERSVSLTGV